MKFALNLLPPKRKEIIFLQGIRKIFLNWSVFLIILVLLTLFFLDLGKNFLTVNLSGLFFERIARQTQLQKDDLSALTLEIKQKKEIVNIIKQTQKETTPFFSYFSDLSKDFPSGIIVEKISLGKDKCFVAGKALDRHAFLAFVQHLEKKPWIKNLSYPLENILVKENTSFNISFDCAN